MTMPCQHQVMLSFFGPYPKVSGPCYVIYLNQTHIFERCVAPTRLVLKAIGLRFQNIF
jgi:hypothetical protein